MKVLSAAIAVADLSEAARRFAHIYGLSATEAFTGDADAWEAMLVAFPFVESGQSFELAEPLPLADPDPAYPTYPVGARFTLARLPEPGALSAHLQTFGESLCRITLAVVNLAESRRYLDEHEVTYMYDRRGEVHPRPVLWILPDQACGAAIVLHEAIN